MFINKKQEYKTREYLQLNTYKNAIKNVRFKY